VQALLGVLAAIALALTLRRPVYVDEESAAVEGGAVRALWALPAMRTLCGLAFVGFGVFVALATWLQTLLHPAGISVILTAAERLAGSAEGTARAMIWMAGNLGGLVMALVVQALVHEPLAAFLAMAAVSLLGVPLATRLPSPATDL
jgi:hypothetical protein